MSTPTPPPEQSKRDAATEEISTWLSGNGSLVVAFVVVLLAVGFVVSIFI